MPPIQKRIWTAKDCNEWLQDPDSYDAKAVKTLRMKGIGLKNLPESIGTLEGLVEIYASDNKLTWIPDSIGDLKKLRLLSLENNGIDSIPDEIGKCKNLEILRLGGNLLTSLPDSFENLQNLVELDLSNNQLTGIPDYIKNIPSLEVMNLDNNPIEEGIGAVTTEELYSKLKNMLRKKWEVDAEHNLYMLIVTSFVYEFIVRNKVSEYRFVNPRLSDLIVKYCKAARKKYKNYLRAIIDKTDIEMPNLTVDNFNRLALDMIAIIKQLSSDRFFSVLFDFLQHSVNGTKVEYSDAHMAKIEQLINGFSDSSHESNNSDLENVNVDDLHTVNTTGDEWTVLPGNNKTKETIPTVLMPYSRTMRRRKRRFRKVKQSRRSTRFLV